jgi:hypothetical protein
MEAMLLALADWRVLLIDSSHNVHVTDHLSSVFVASGAELRELCEAAGVPLHTGRHMHAYASDLIDV